MRFQALTGRCAAVVGLVALLIARNPIARADSVPRPARYYIGIGVSNARSVLVDAGQLHGARSFLASRVEQLEGVIIAPESETAREAQTVLRKHSLTGYYLYATISNIERQANGRLKASVSILVATYPDQEMRAIMQGSATVENGATRGAERAAIEAALSSALRELSKALAR
jgi:hypothetical protein